MTVGRLPPQLGAKEPTQREGLASALATRPASRRVPTGAFPSLTIQLPVFIAVMVGVVLLLSLGHLLTTLAPVLQGGTPVEAAHQFDLGRENNLPTWYASISLLLCATLLALIGWAKHRTLDPFRWHWLALAAGFLMLSADEAASIHELVGRSIESHIHFEGAFYYGSIIPMLGCVGLIAFTFLRFWWHLPMLIRVRVALSGLLYVGGAVGLEMLESREEWLTQSQSTAIYHTMVFVEELLEMSGVVLFLSSLAGYLREGPGSLTVTIDAGGPRNSSLGTTQSATRIAA